MRNRTTTSRGRMKRRRSEIFDLRIVINRRRQTALRTNEHVDNSEILESSGNKEDAKDIAELISIRPKIDYSDILVSSDDMNKDDENNDFSGDICERNRQNELLKFSDDKETSYPNVSNCNVNREISKKKDDGHRSRQVQKNDFSITSRKYDDVETKRRKDQHIHELGHIKSIPLDRVCDSTKDPDESSEIDRETIRRVEIREEGEVYEDKYVQKQPIKDWSSLRRYGNDAVGMKPKKRRH